MFMIVTMVLINNSLMDHQFKINHKNMIYKIWIKYNSHLEVLTKMN